MLARDPGCFYSVFRVQTAMKLPFFSPSKDCLWIDYVNCKVKPVWSSLVISGFLAILSSSCAANSGIEDVAKFSKQAKADIMSVSPALVNDISESCKRTQALQLPTGEKLFQEDPNTGRLIFLIDKNIQSRCATKEMKKATDSYKSGHILIANYIATIGKLAGANLPIFDTQMQALVPALGGLPFIADKDSKATVDAGGSIATILFRVFGEGFQRSQLISTMSAADLPLQVIAMNYGNSITNYYMNGLLETEMLAVTAFYGNPLDNARRPTTSPVLLGINPFITTSLTRSLVAERQEVNKRKAFAETYVTLLYEVSCDHTKLKEALQGKSISNAIQINSLCKRLQTNNNTSRNTHVNQEETASAYISEMIPKYQRLLSRLNKLSSLKSKQHANFNSL